MWTWPCAFFERQLNISDKAVVTARVYPGFDAGLSPRPPNTSNHGCSDSAVDTKRPSHQVLRRHKGDTSASRACCRAPFPAWVQDYTYRGGLHGEHLFPPMPYLLATVDPRKATTSPVQPPFATTRRRTLVPQFLGVFK
jgi:hypothetical protein